MHRKNNMESNKVISWTGLILTMSLISIWGFHWEMDPPAIHLVGDSTMAERSEPVSLNPERGWGQALDSYLDKQAKIYNHAVNGRSTKSFIEEGRWEKVLDLLRPGDVVLIQFGHNDQKEKDPERYTNPTTAYWNNLTHFVRDVRRKKAMPVLLTPIVRRKFNEYGTLTDTHGLYPLIVRQVAREQEVHFIDHLSKTEELIADYGQEKSKELYIWIKPGQYGKFPDGRQDDTHLSEKGAALFARIIAEELQNSDIPLKKLINLK